MTSHAESTHGILDVKQLKGYSTGLSTSVPTHLSGSTGGNNNHPDPIDNFVALQFVEKPDSLMNRETLPQTLQDCVGYLQALPLVQPNVDAKDPVSIANMVNILTLQSAQAKLDAAMDLTLDSQFTLPPAAYCDQQLRAYDATAEPMVSLLAAANKVTAHQPGPPLLGHVVLPGNIGLYMKLGIVYAVPEGRWWLLPDVLANWLPQGRNVSLDQDFISTASQGGSLLIIRINEGQCGLITDKGKSKILAVGTHVFNSGTVKFVGRINFSEKQYFNHGPYHYVNVPRGNYAKVWAEVVGPDGVKSLVPRLLREGEHFIKSNLFKFNGPVDVSAEYIGHGSVHILNVLQGHVAKIAHNNIPRLLGAGEHIIETPNFAYKGAVNIAKNLCITHGTITIVQVPQAKVALAWNKNEPQFIDRPGKSVVVVDAVIAVPKQFNFSFVFLQRCRNL